MVTSRVGLFRPVGPVRPILAVPFPNILVSSPTLPSSNQISIETQMGRLDSIGNNVVSFSLDNSTGF